MPLLVHWACKATESQWDTRAGATGASPPARVALVTGANHGIGAATAKALAAQGNAVLCAYFRNEELGASTTPRCRRHTGPPAWRGPTTSPSPSVPQVVGRWPSRPI